MARKYPLEALRDRRERAVDDLTAKVAERQRETVAARARLSAARRALEAEEARSAEVAETERERLASGRARVQDLQRHADFEVGAEARRDQSAARERAAERAVVEASAREAGERRELADAAANARAVERHRGDWAGEQARRLEQAEDDAAADVWANRHASKKSERPS